MNPTPPFPQPLPQPLAELLCRWLPAQRWYPAKGVDAVLTPRQLESTAVLELADPAGLAALVIHVVALDTGTRTEYLQLPMSLRPEPVEHLAGALIGTLEDPLLGTRWVYDGVHDQAFIGAWLDVLAGTREASGLAGDATAELSAAHQSGQLPASRVLSGEQSNSSVLVPHPAQPLMVKFYRTVHPGTNPDVELGRALSDAGCEDVPAMLGSASGVWSTPSGPVSGTLAVVHRFVPDADGGWELALSAALDNTDFSAQAQALGRATARVHQALLAALGAHSPTAAESTAMVEAIVGRLRWAWAECGAAVGPFDAHLEGVIDRLRAVEELPPLQRIHGDLHLGQWLAAPAGSAPDGSPSGGGTDAQARRWLLLDFEGEPLRPIADRSHEDLALRDVVGMLRSFDYAAGTGANTGAAAGSWAQRAEDAFLAGYGTSQSARAGKGSALFMALWLDKALYEVVYEQRNRPGWVHIPVAGVRAAFLSMESGAQMAQNTPTPLPVDQAVLASVAEGTYYAPHSVLGAHLDDDGNVTFRTLRHLAESVVVLLDGGVRLPMVHELGGIFTAVAPAAVAGHVPDYRLEVAYTGVPAAVVDDPYRYLPTVGEVDLHLIAEGRHETLWTVLGAHVQRYHSILGDVRGVSFAVWAPNAQAVRVKGDFNNWDGRMNAMRSLGSSGIWELFIPDAEVGACYKFEIRANHGGWVEKADPMAYGTQVPPLTASRVVESNYAFTDQEWMATRAATDPQNAPMSVYEVHLGSWKLGLSYTELATELVDYVKWMGFTHVELMPVAEHPFGGSWGYQVTSYFAPTSRFGHPDEFRFLVDALHKAGIGVIMDWVPAHFPKDDWALARFDGQALYEHADPRLGEHPDWGTLIFDFGRNEVRNFLVANALYWIEEFHIDGLRVDAVASMLYLDYSREDGQWSPNRHGGRENLEAMSFLQEMNATVYKRNPGAITIAEESTAFPGVTAPTSGGGLGFGLKWNMGWMHDSLTYMAEDPVNRGWHHNQITFSMVYAFTENFLLPISHDEVVHGKGSMLAKMPGDRWRQLANLRAYLAFQWAHPGKALIFMGTEFGQESEWSEAYGLDWGLADMPGHHGVQLLVKSLNETYRSTPALSDLDNTHEGFTWINGGDTEHNVLSFIRWDKDGNPLVAVINFGGNPHHDYRLGLPLVGEWTEALNTDDAEFGGSGVGNGGAVIATKQDWDGQPASAAISLPPLGALYLVPSKTAPKTKTTAKTKATAQPKAALKAPAKAKLATEPKTKPAAK
ncbi:1,4-alpha-glucan branching protein GlgB [Arthrobacter sp. 35W]|uniref:1,4-alpha-glucan branching protein GlgB n=1 Tax=Arthrobacter sp. 35W TaxID=1132441 RepID=UPI000406B93D|nr:1,4-alpha-glucan branching protein GlgB [Arthrobacter sp. 35W]